MSTRAISVRQLPLASMAVALLGVLPAVVTPTAAGEARPNVLLILADDLGWADLACYGHSFHETPNLDKLANQGMRFTDAYAASCVCSPTRSSIMTGKYPARNDLTIWLGGHGGAPAVDHMALEEVTIAESLKQQGYATAHVGKWHLGGEPYLPQHQGFDVITAARLDKSELGVQLASLQTGLALTKIDDPVKGGVKFRLRIRPSTEHPSNGFLAFGDGASDKDLIKCGLLVGGGNISIYEGVYPSPVGDSRKTPLTGGKIYDVAVTVDLQQQSVTLAVGDQSVVHRFQKELKQITFFGYAAIRTNTSFGPVELEPVNP